MFNIGAWELTMILMFALLLLGPQKLPEFARWIGRVVREVRKTTQDVRDAIDLEIEREEFNRLKEEFAHTIDDTQQLVHGQLDNFYSLDPLPGEEEETSAQASAEGATGQDLQAAAGAGQELSEGSGEVEPVAFVEPSTPLDHPGPDSFDYPESDAASSAPAASEDIKSESVAENSPNPQEED